jgi:putative endonuclease
MNQNTDYFMYYVYIIRSLKDGTFYKGYSSDYEKRLEEHNLGLSTYTSTKLPWELVYVESHIKKANAIIRERKLKRCNSRYLLWLTEQDSNIIKRK